MHKPRYPELIVGALLVNTQGEVFVARFSKVEGRFAIPGGHVEYGETVAEALVRELCEETGLVPTRYRLLRVSERIRPPLYKDGTHHLVYLDFLVDRWTGELQLDGVELNDGRWLAPQAALDLPLTFTTCQVIQFYLAHSDGGACRYEPGRAD
ncbi:MAG: NUDIX domain-containing protein [Anaerolineae bacterium]|jgi:8-oxo-dGTP pyrophosphatase MutT (NUDIX family)